MAGKRIHVVMDLGLVEAVDALAEGIGISRGEVIRRAVEKELRAVQASFPQGAVEQALSETQGPRARQQADRGSVPSAEGVRSAAPAEQPPSGSEFRFEPAVVPSACPRHPDAERVRVKGSDRWWCSEPGCSASFSAGKS